MDTIIYIGTAVLTIVWTVWTYLAWSDHAALPESSSLRFALIVAPSAYFLLIALSGWERAMYIRLDLIGIAVFDGLILLCWIILLFMRGIKAVNFKKGYIFILIVFNILGVLIVASAHLIKLFPVLIIHLTNLISQGLSFDFFQFAWIGLDPETHEHDLAGMVNKILIALLSYVPISLLRTLYINRQIGRQRKTMSGEIKALKKRIEKLEEKVEN